MEHFDDILPSHIRASKIRLSYIEELFPDLKNDSYIVLHKTVSEKIRFSLVCDLA